MKKRFDRSGYQRNMGRCTGTKKYSNGRIGNCDHPSHGCFSSDTLVATPKGPLQISDIAVGQEVTSATGVFFKCRSSVVRRVTTFGNRRLYVLALGSAVLRATGTHTVLTRRGWMRVDCLMLGDYLTGVGAPNDLAVDSISVTLSREPVFNLIVENDYNFILGIGCVAHSFTFARAPRVALGRLSDLIRHLISHIRFGKRRKGLVTT